MIQAKLIYTCTKRQPTSWNFHIGPTSLWFFLGKVSLWCFFTPDTNLFFHSQPAYTQVVLLQGWQTKIQQILFSFPKPVNRDNLGALIVAPPTSLPCPGVRVLGSATLNHSITSFLVHKQASVDLGQVVLTRELLSLFCSLHGALSSSLLGPLHQKSENLLFLLVVHSSSAGCVNTNTPLELPASSLGIYWANKLAATNKCFSSIM